MADSPPDSFADFDPSILENSWSRKSPINQRGETDMSGPDTDDDSGWDNFGDGDGGATDKLNDLLMEAPKLYEESLISDALNGYQVDRYINLFSKDTQEAVASRKGDGLNDKPESGQSAG